MKIMCSPGHHPQWFCALGHMMYCYVHNVHDVTVYHVPKCISCHKATVVINGRLHCFHGYIYVMPILLLGDLSARYVFSELRVLCCLLNNLQPNEQQQPNLLQHNGFILEMTSQHKLQENPLYSREKYPRE